MLIQRDLGNKPYSEEFMGVYLDLGYLFALLKDYESAADYFIKASKFWQGYMDNVRNAPDLEDFRTNGQAAFRRFNKTMLEYHHEKEATRKY
jgi:hypothetical protein